MAQVRGIKIRIQVNMYAGDAGGCEYTENLNIPVRAGLDHVEALAILVTELAHFESGARKAIAAGIIEDAVPETRE